nr:MAG TPA: hypothetical protein [Caudoviricetes sp.]
MIEQLALGLTPQLPKWELCHVRKKRTRKQKQAGFLLSFLFS